MNTQQEENAGGVPAVSMATAMKLPPFWPHAPALWFAQAECQFTVRGVEDEFQRYCLVVSVLPHESLRLVANIVETPPLTHRYTAIKERLLASHQLTGYQRAEKLLTMPALGACKPSELMAAMLEICPRGEEKTELFACLFLQRLPCELRILLGRADHKDHKALADEADKLWGMHVTSADQLAALAVDVEQPEGTLAAMRPAADFARGHGGRGQHGRGAGNGRQRPLMKSQALKEARLSAGLCIKHWRYGEQANSCVQPCSWSGNGQAVGN
jgi:hypothetical protein